MSLTTNGLTASAWPEQRASTAAPMRLRRINGREKLFEFDFIGKNQRVSHWTRTYSQPPRNRSSEQPRQVIEDGKRHQHEQQAYPRALSEFSHSLGQGTPGQNFQRIIQQKPTIQNR